MKLKINLFKTILGISTLIIAGSILYSMVITPEIKKFRINKCFEEIKEKNKEMFEGGINLGQQNIIYDACGKWIKL